MFTFPITPQPPKPNSDEKKESDFDLEYEEIDFDVKSYNFLRKLGFDDTKAYLILLHFFLFFNKKRIAKARSCGQPFWIMFLTWL